MPQLSMEDLTDQERAAIDEALAALDPYLAMSKVDWSVPLKEMKE